jgi:hypothetical protein
MKTTSFKSDGLTVLALLLALPTAWFILIAVLKYGLGIDGPFDSLPPTLESWGIKESLGWNINLLILFGPVLAFLLGIFQVLAVGFRFDKHEWVLHFTVQKKWFPLLVTAFSIGLLAILFIYMLGENCNC